jgi:ABC-type uncharacterized transport system substrate-binding protein
MSNDTANSREGRPSGSPETGVKSPALRFMIMILITILALVIPDVSMAQTRVPHIGVLLLPAPPPIGPASVDGFRAALRELGYVEGQSVSIEIRYAEGRAERLPALAAELVRLGVDVIFTVSTPPAHAAKDATTTIPIVMIAGEPVATGLVASLAHPGSNVTGISASSAEGAGKRLQLLQELVPHTTRVGLLIHRTDPFAQPLLEQTRNSWRRSDWRGAP